MALMSKRGNGRSFKRVAGSVFSLGPGVRYEVRFTMTDPGGGMPKKSKFAIVAARRESNDYGDERTHYGPRVKIVTECFHD